MKPSRRNACDSLNFVVLFVLLPTEEAYRFRAISKFEDLDHFYASVKFLRGEYVMPRRERCIQDRYTARNFNDFSPSHEDRVEPISRTNDRRELCRQIFNHPYFSTRGVQWIDPNDDKVLSDIVKANARISSALYTSSKVPREHCPSCCYCEDSPELEEKFSMLKQFYEDKPEDLKKCIAWCLYRTTDYAYDNTPKDLAVVVGTGRESELVFLCPVRTGRNDIDAYYVSENDYNMNGANSNDEIMEYIPGKFIFALKHTRPSVVIRIGALVEDTARVVVGTQAEEFYLKRPLNQTPSK